MKLQLILSVTFFLLIFCSCSYQESEVMPGSELKIAESLGAELSDNKINELRTPTPEEYQDLFNKGIWLGTESVTCEWSDGQYGSIECDGVCDVGLTATDVCLLCRVDGVIVEIGACRPQNP